MTDTTKKPIKVFNVAMLGKDYKLRALKLGKDALEFDAIKDAIACAKALIIGNPDSYHTVVGEWLGKGEIRARTYIYPSGNVYPAKGE